MHPKHRDIVDHIQGKYSFKERPQKSIIVKTGSATKVDLSADNYKGVVVSYVFLTKYKNFPGNSIEWVREDNLAISANRGLFPSPPGVYYIDVVEVEDTTDPTGKHLAFYVDPLLDVRHEQIVPTGTQAFLKKPPLDGTVRLYEMPSSFLLVEGVNYTLVKDSEGNPTGEITLTQPLAKNLYLSADYRYPAPSSPTPWPIYPEFANNQALPGAVLAFGQRAEAGDKMAVVVQDMRRPAALEYGGRWSLTLDFDVSARDVYAQREIADQSVMYMWAVLRPRLSSEGLEMMDISMGGESEEVYDENGDDYFFNSSFNVTVETEWSLHVPLPVFIRSVSPLTNEQYNVMAGLPDEAVSSVQSNIREMNALDLEAIVDPYFIPGKFDTFEMLD